MNELINIEKINPVAVFSGELDPLLESITNEVNGIVPDLTTDKGRKEIASLANKVARSKTYLDDLGKTLVSDWKEKAKKVDSERKRMRDYLDNLKAKVRKPLTDWENAEADRVRAIQNKIACFDALCLDLDVDSVELESRLVDLRATKIDKFFEEFANEAAIKKDAAILTLEAAFDKRMAYEAEQKELEKLRKEAEERSIKDREDKLRKEGEEKAKREAEEKARQEAVRMESERLNAIKAKEDAESRAIEAEARSKREAEDAAKHEREKIEQERLSEEMAAKKREADLAHKANINNAILKALTSIGLSDEQGKATIKAIVKGQVPYTKISY